MGVNIARVKIGVYALGGVMGALAGVVATIDTGAGSPAEYVGYELDAIAAVVIGGTLLTGGTGFVFGTLLGMLILGLIRLIIDNEGTLSSWWTNISAGVLLFLFIALQSLLTGVAGTWEPVREKRHEEYDEPAPLGPELRNKEDGATGRHNESQPVACPKPLQHHGRLVRMAQSANQHMTALS